MTHDRRLRSTRMLAVVLGAVVLAALGTRLSSAPLTIDFANLQFPPTLSHVVSVVDSTSLVFGQLYIAGETDAQPTVVEGIQAQVGYGPPGTLPSSDDWEWFDMRPNPGYDFTLNNDEYIGRMLPLRTGTFKFTTRWSADGGATWTYTDQFGPPYDEADAGDITITQGNDTTPPSIPTDLAVEDVSDAFVTLNWQPSLNVDGDVVGYLVERKLASSSSFTRVADFNDLTGADTDTYTDSEVTTGETYEYRVQAYDASANVSSPSNTVQVSASNRAVDVTFRVTIPEETPGAFPIYVTGTFQDSPFTHGAPDWQLTESSPGTWEGTFRLADNTTYEYRYTRGAEARVETEADGTTPIPRRSLTVAFGSDGTQQVDDTVAGWKDPFVTTLSPPDGATGLIGDQVTVDLTWDEAMPPELQGFALTGSSGAVNGSWSYDAATRTHTFTPDARLPVDTYTVTQSGAVDQGGDVQAVDTSSTFSVGAIPVELSGLDASLDETRVVLTWQTLSESSNAGFTVQRRAENTADFVSIGSVEGDGTTREKQSYRFVDENLPFRAESLTYRLKQVDTDGAVEYSREETVRRGRPEEVQLHGSFPNPARTTATIRYELPEALPVRLSVYDILGRHVTTLVDRRKDGGRHQHTVDVSGLASGTYFVRLHTGEGVANASFTVVR